TVGIDLVAMNVNDIVCVGAKPISFVDYVGVEEARGPVLEAVGQGLYRGAELAGVTICGGEIAQLGEMIKGVEPGAGLDLVGTAIGLVENGGEIIGAELEKGDTVLGLASSGIHSNGLSLARKVLLEQASISLDAHRAELGRTLAEELLEPTRVYSKQVSDLFAQNAQIKALVHVTGGGFENLMRVKKRASFSIDNLPDPPPVFKLIQSEGGVSTEEMYRVFNMGVGFCLVCARADADSIKRVLEGHGITARRIGQVSETGVSKVVLEEEGVTLR
ncbi:MAG: phosphoribosylformylglycinamidine cyclo-ligase, partial [Terriglobia bacterium]